MLPLILISDNDSKDIYNSVLKYKILTQCHDVQIFEYYVNSNADKVNNAASYILLHEHHFPENTVFFVEVNTAENIESQKILLIHYHQKWILTPDNGIIGLLDKEKIKHIFCWEETIQTSFYGIHEMLNALKNLVNSRFLVSKDFSKISFEKCKKLYWNSKIERELNNKEKNIVLPLLYTDSYHNLIFNFKKQEYEQYIQEYNVEIKLPLGDVIKTIHSTYNQKNTNEPVAVFNDAGYLEIAINGAALAPLVVTQDIYTGTNFSILLHLKPKQK